jgi:hypothetical protein
MPYVNEGRCTVSRAASRGLHLAQSELGDHLRLV